MFEDTSHSVWHTDLSLWAHEDRGSVSHILDNLCPLRKPGPSTLDFAGQYLLNFWSVALKSLTYLWNTVPQTVAPLKILREHQAGLLNKFLQ